MQGRRGERKVVIRMPRKQQQQQPGATTATSERVVMPRKSFVVGLGVTTVVSLNCFLCVMVARKAFLLPSFAVQDAEDGDGPEHSGAARTGEGAHHRTAPVFHAAAAHRASTASDGRGSRATAAGPTLCSTTAMCERLEAYLGDTLDRDKDPCDDFYGYVCSRRRGRVEAPLPVQSQGSGGLLYGIQRALSHYVASHEQAYQDFPGVFLNKAAYFLPNCTSTYSRNRLGWEPWQDVLKMADLQDWPHRHGLSLGYSRVSDTAAKIDALLGVFPFVQVRVKSEYERCCAVQLDVPSTVFKRHALWHARDPAPNYTDTVFGALTLLGYVPGSEELARDVAVLETRLENALDLRGGPSFGGNRPRAPGELPVSRRSWHWRSYLETLLAGTASDARNGTSKGGSSSRPAVASVEVWASEYLQDLAEVMENSSRTALFNYVGYRLMVHLSPLLPDDAAFLVPLSHEHAVHGGSDRLQVPREQSAPGLRICSGSQPAVRAVRGARPSAGRNGGAGRGARAGGGAVPAAGPARGGGRARRRGRPPAPHPELVEQDGPQELRCRQGVLLRRVQGGHADDTGQGCGRCAGHERASGREPPARAAVRALPASPGHGRGGGSRAPQSRGRAHLRAALLRAVRDGAVRAPTGYRAAAGVVRRGAGQGARQRRPAQPPAVRRRLRLPARSRHAAEENVSQLVVATWGLDRRLREPKGCPRGNRVCKLVLSIFLMLFFKGNSHIPGQLRLMETDAANSRARDVAYNASV
ncbi:uncharacterized protein [Dermacentor albipictus]|uniref:uncharacterized protein isoform X2 n=1 Tax=Dermacentor albipictus TaxID=60249 RepID=UPI0031FD0F10